MKKIGYLITKYYKVILILSILFVIPALIGMYKTKINYDILVYLPDDIETIKGEKILTDDFHTGAYAIAIIENMKDKDIISLEQKIKEIDGVSKVISIDDITGSQIPIEYIPSTIKDKVSSNKSKLVFITFSNSTSDDKTLAAVESIRSLVNKSSKVGGMSAMVLDTKQLFNNEMTLYVIIAVIFCIIVLMISLDSYIVPFLLILNIGVAILYNMGTNIFLGDISYITKAISSVLQLGVTTDFSIFLYHKYESAKKKNKDIKKAMTNAIADTLVSVLGSSLTTIAGFLALCTMNLKLGMDIGIVMAKGVVFGLICVVTLFPALLLTFDKLIDKTTHKTILPKFKHIKTFVLKHYKFIFIIFIILLIPAYKSQTKTPVYYKLDESIPDNYGYTKATKTLKDDYNIVSQEIILLSNDLSIADTNQMIDEIEKIPGIKSVLSSSKLYQYGIDESMLNQDLRNIIKTDKYKLMLINSNYDIATNELNNQITKITSIVKKYDKKAIVAGEGPLMKDLVEITDKDFKNVNYTSIIIIFALMLLVLKSIALPVLLVSVIEFAIFINMGIPYFESTQIPFIASVVIGTIQLGATIDYAILMTSTYLNERKKGKEKMEAIKYSLDTSISSIFVSGMCFFAATVGVALVSKIDLIGSLCTLISRGAIISMIVVMFVLPSILIIFDKLIVTTTLGFKKGRKNMKKKLAIISMICLLSLTVLPVKALTKEETVYAKLNSNGKLKEVTVTNHLINEEKQNTIIDYSDLTNIENTSSNAKVTIKNNKLTWDANKKDIYYKGKSNNTLPISLDIKYKLNNKEQKLNNILGKKGHVDIIIHYKNLDKHNDLYTPFVIATTTILDGTNNSNINIDNGKVVSNGTNYIVAGISMPGLYESLNIESLKNMDTITISFDTTKFSLPSIYSVATPKLIDKIDLDKINGLDSIYNDINKLSNGSKSLVEGSKKINDGATTIYNGVSTSIENLKNNKDTIDEKTLSNIQNQASQQTIATIEQRKEEIMNQAIESVIKTEKETHQIKQASDYEIENNENLINALKLASHEQMKANEQTKQIYDGCLSLITDYCSYVTQAENQAIEKMKEAMYNQALELASQTAANTAYQTALKIAQETSFTVSGTVAKEVSNQSKNTVLNKVILSLEELKKGLEQLTTGTKELQQGIETLDNQGINKITNIVNNDIKPSLIKVKELKSLAHNYNSFTGTKDIDTNTKFIIIIDSVKPKEKEITKENHSQKQTVIDRIKDLFK